MIKYKEGLKFEDMLNKVIWGDCLEVMKAIPDKSVDLVVTSPPYNKHSAKRKHSPSDTWTKSAISYGENKDDLPENEYRLQQIKVIKELLIMAYENESIMFDHRGHSCYYHTGDFLDDSVEYEEEPE